MKALFTNPRRVLIELSIDLGACLVIYGMAKLAEWLGVLS